MECNKSNELRLICMVGLPRVMLRRPVRFRLRQNRACFRPSQESCNVLVRVKGGKAISCFELADTLQRSKMLEFFRFLPTWQSCDFLKDLGLEQSHVLGRVKGGKLACWDNFVPLKEWCATLKEITVHFCTWSCKCLFTKGASRVVP